MKELKSKTPPTKPPRPIPPPVSSTTKGIDVKKTVLEAQKQETERLKKNIHLKGEPPLPPPKKSRLWDRIVRKFEKKIP
jgi:hypothetical protein